MVEPKVLSSRHVVKSALMEAYPALLTNGKEKEQRLALPNGKIVHSIPWSGNVPAYALLSEVEGYYARRRLFGLYAEKDLSEAELLSIHRTLQKRTGNRLHVIVPRLLSISGHGFALIVERVVVSPRPIKHGLVLHCTNNKSLTQSKDLIFACAKADLTPYVYPSIYSANQKINTRISQQRCLTKTTDPEISLLDLYELTKKEYPC